MSSKLRLTTSTQLPLVQAADGEMFFETDTGKVLVHYQGTFFSYSKRSIRFATTGADDLAYPAGIFIDPSANHYIDAAPILHYDSMRIEGSDITTYNDGHTINSSVGPFAWINRANPGAHDLRFSGYSNAVKIYTHSTTQGVVLTTGTSTLIENGDPDVYAANGTSVSDTITRTSNEPFTLVSVIRRTASSGHPVMFGNLNTTSLWGAFNGNHWQSTAPAGGTVSSTLGIDQPTWDQVHAQYGADYIVQIVRYDGTGQVKWTINDDVHTYARSTSTLSMGSIRIDTSTEHYEEMVFDQSLSNDNINKLLAYFNNRYSTSLSDWS